MEMNMKMGDYIKTLIDKDAPWGSETIHLPSGSIGLVCEVFEVDAFRNTRFPSFCSCAL